MKSAIANDPDTLVQERPQIQAWRGGDVMGHFARLILQNKGSRRLSAVSHKLIQIAMSIIVLQQGVRV